MTKLEQMAVIGYAMYIKGFPKEKLDSLKGIEIMMLRSDFEKWINNQNNNNNNNNN